MKDFTNGPDLSSEASTPTIEALPLTRRTLVAGLRKRGHSTELSRLALGVVISAMVESFTQGRGIIFRGFGHFKVRCYTGSTKRLGLIFRPSRKLMGRLNCKVLK